jgi:hypothetical protein
MTRKEKIEWLILRDLDDFDHGMDAEAEFCTTMRGLRMPYAGMNDAQLDAAILERRDEEGEDA